MTDAFRAAFLAQSADDFRKLKEHADRAFTQVSDEQFFALPGPESNSLAVINRHISGNLLSRWRDFLTADGEKPDRRRDTEFEVPEELTRAAVMARWEEGWRCLFDELGRLIPADLDRNVTIRGEPHTVVQAIHRQITHNASHVGQIVYLAKLLAGTDWKTLSVPRGKSEEFNRQMKEKYR